MIYIKLFFEFFKIGLFAVGGGLATLPFLQKLSEDTGWYTTSELTNMLAIAESTPGPIGVNMSTYVGFAVAGIQGAILATFALVLPSYIIIIIVSNFLQRFEKSIYVQNIFTIIKPVVTGLIGVSFIIILKASVFSSGFDIVKIIVFGLMLFLIIKFKKHPIFYIFIGGILGFLLKFD